MDRDSTAKVYPGRKAQPARESTGLTSTDWRQGKKSEILIMLRVGGRPVSLQEPPEQRLWHILIFLDMNPCREAGGKNNPKLVCFSIFIKVLHSAVVYQALMIS